MSSIDKVAVKYCTLCRHNESEHLMTHIPQASRPSNVWVRCRVCGLVYANPRPSDEWLHDYYSNGGYRMMVFGTNDPVASIQDEVERSSRLATVVQRMTTKVERHLDIGSSTGAMLATVHGLYESEEVGIELSQSYRDKTLELFAEAEAQLPRLYTTLDDVEDETFDLITAIHVLEHMTDPVSFLNEAYGLLTDNGLLIVEVPNLYGGPTSPLMFPHLYGFSHQTLMHMLEEVGYAVLDVESYGAFPPYYTAPAHMTAIAGKRKEHKDWVMNRINRSEEHKSRIKMAIARSEGYSVG